LAKLLAAAIMQKLARHFYGYLNHSALAFLTPFFKTDQRLSGGSVFRFLFPVVSDIYSNNRQTGFYRLWQGALNIK
jgi:hypothetical protein